jgi:prophage antirepressor-like protein
VRHVAHYPKHFVPLDQGREDTEVPNPETWSIIVQEVGYRKDFARRRKMNQMQKFSFDGRDVEVIVLDGQPLFNSGHVGECLHMRGSTLRGHLASMKASQVITVTSADVGLTHIRKIDDCGEIFLTESGLYRLIFTSKDPVDAKFQSWIVDEVLPSIRAISNVDDPTKQMSRLDPGLPVS